MFLLYDFSIFVVNKNIIINETIYIFIFYIYLVFPLWMR